MVESAAAIVKLFMIVYLAQAGVAVHEVGRFESMEACEQAAREAKFAPTPDSPTAPTLNFVCVEAGLPD